MADQEDKEGGDSKDHSKSVFSRGVIFLFASIRAWWARGEKFWCWRSWIISMGAEDFEDWFPLPRRMGMY